MNRHHLEIILLLAFLLSGCDRLNPQANAESKFGDAVIWWMRDHDAVSTNVPVTNLAQLFVYVKDGYPFYHHQELARFGKNAGFTNSLVEKYVFFFPRFSHDLVEGQVVCMNARPFSGHGKQTYRSYIAKLDGTYIYRSIPEETAQRILQEAKPRIVSSGVQSPPPLPPRINPTLRERYERFVWDLSAALDQDSSTPVRVALPIIASLLLGGLVWACLLLLRRRRS